MKLEEFKKTMSNYKKKYNLSVCKFRYHNKNNSGGNFGYYVRLGGNWDDWIVIHGKYNNNKQLHNISFEGSKLNGFLYYEHLGDNPIKYIIESNFKKDK